MKYEGQRTLKATPYNPDRFRDNDMLLIEIIFKIDEQHYMYLYYEDAVLSLGVDSDDRLAYIDRKARRGFKEGVNCYQINVYDRYSVEHLRYDYTDKRYRAVESLMIYANGLVKPAIRFYHKLGDENPMGYKYHCVIKKPIGRE